MTVSFGAQGSGGTSATSIGIAWPAGLAAGHYLLFALANGDNTTSVPTIVTGGTGLAQLAAAANSDGTFGDSVGPRRITWFGKEAAGTESGSVTFTHTAGGASVIGGIGYRWSKTEATWIVAAHEADYSAGDEANITAVFADVDLQPGDQLHLAYASPSDTVGVSGQAFSASGITFGGATELVDVGQTTGNDIRIMTCRDSVSSGSGTVDVTFTATQDVSCGLVLLVLRDADDGVTGAATTTAPSATIAGAGSVTVDGTSEPAAPAATTDATAAAIVAGAGSSASPAAAVAGTGSTSASATGAVAAPASVAAGAAGATISGAGAATGPASTTGASAEAPISTAGTITAPAGQLAGSGTSESTASTGTAQATASPGTITGAGTTTVAGAGAVTAPPGRLSGITEELDGPATFSITARAAIGSNGRAAATAGVASRTAPAAGMEPTTTEEVTFGHG